MVVKQITTPVYWVEIAESEMPKNIRKNIMTQCECFTVAYMVQRF